jgi:hypothetical protein
MSCMVTAELEQTPGLPLCDLVDLLRLTLYHKDA